MPEKIKLPPGAKLVDENTPLPPGAKLVSANGGTPATNAPEIHASPQFPSPGWFKEKAYGVADKVTNALPAIGGIGGGFLGGAGGTVAGLGFGGVPGAVGGAALGGAAGESARQLARRAIFPASKGWTSGIPQTSGEAAQDIGTEALKQGAYEAGGRGLQIAGKAIAPRLAEAAVAPGKRLLKSVPEDVNIGKTILDETNAIRPKAIVGQLDTKIAGHSAAEDEALQSAKQAGKIVSLAPARKIVASEAESAVGKNSPSYLKDVSKVNEQLNYQYGPDGRILTRPNPASVAPPPARRIGFIDSGQGGHAGGGVASVEELNRPGSNFVVGRNNAVTAHGKAFAPESISEGSAHVTVLPSGEFRTNGGILSDAQNDALRRTIGNIDIGTNRAPIGLPDVPVQLPETVDPVRARSLRQGIDTEIGNWNPEAQSAIAPLQRRVYGSLTGEIHNAVPEAAAHDKAMTSLIPSREAAWNTSFNPGVTRGVVERFARPTGALLGTVVGGEEGYRHGGILGGIGGAAMGGILPSAITTPTGLMFAARTANSGIVPGVIRVAAPIGEGVMTKPSASKDKRPGEPEHEEY